MPNINPNMAKFTFKKVQELIDRVEKHPNLSAVSKKMSKIAIEDLRFREELKTKGKNIDVSG
jgi:hypothetical protein